MKFSSISVLFATSVVPAWSTNDQDHRSLSGLSEEDLCNQYSCTAVGGCLIIEGDNYFCDIDPNYFDSESACINFGYFCENYIGGGSGSSGSASGDPHIKTWSGKYFDFMGQCDLVMAKSKKYDSGKGLEVQIRTQIKDDWSFIAAAAIKIGSHILEVHDNGKYYLDGVADADLFDSNLAGHRITWQSERIQSGLTFQLFTIHLLNGTKILVEVKNKLLDVSINGAKFEDLGDSIGLMGDFSKGGKLLGRDEQTVFEDYNLYGQEWQVRDDDDETTSFMSPGDGPHSPSKCIFPEQSKSLEERRMLRGGDSSKIVLDAEKACSSWPKDMRDACIFDVLATGDLTMAIRDVF